MSLSTDITLNDGSFKLIVKWGFFEDFSEIVEKFCYENVKKKYVSILSRARRRSFFFNFQRF